MSSNRNIITLLPLFFVIVIDTMGVGLIFPIISPLFMEKTGGLLAPDVSVFMRDFLFGVSIASFTFFMLFGAPFLGDLSDFIGRKKVLIISLLGTAISYLVSGFGVEWHSVFWLIAGRCVAGFAAGSQPIAQAAIADVSTAKNKAVNMGFLALATCLGFIVGPLIGGYFANPKWFGYSTPFFIAAILAACNAISVAFTFTETFQPQHKQKIQITRGLFIFVSAFTHKKIRPMINVLLLAQTAFAIYLSFVSIYVVQTYHYTSVQIGHFMAYFGVVLAINYLLLVRLSVKYFNLKQIIWISLLITAVSMLMMLYEKLWMVWLAVIPIGIGNALFYTALITLLSNMVDADSQGWIMGITGAATAAAWTLGGLFTGFGAVHVFLPYILAALLLFIALIIFLRYASQLSS